jgi:hypothetical protein
MADLNARGVTLSNVLGVGALENEIETVSVGDALPESSDDAESRREGELTKETVANGAVAVTASDALTGEVEGEGVEDFDGEIIAEAVAQGLPLMLLKLLLLADTHLDTLVQYELNCVTDGVGEEANVD